MMAKKETKAERTEREAAVHAAYLAELKATYNSRLMSALARAQSVDFSLTALADMTFMVEKRNSKYNINISLPLVYSTSAEDSLESLLWEVQSLEDYKQEQQRVYLAKQAALAKLTPEERELLKV